ncbi:MAG TPA: hypothetical protein VJP81_04005 [Candidatus Dormibacteraeota bacterium]|nr:hypothetical protein [Candidatus Dormibacteraeota bacterium]
MGIADDQSTWREWNGATFEHTARVLCKPCNSRLGELEGRVRPIAEDLIASRATSIDADHQPILASWLYKTGLMVASTIKQEAASLPHEHYSELKGEFDLPPGSVVWVGLLDRRVNEAALHIQRFGWWDRQAAEPVHCGGYILVLGIGELASIIGVLDTRQSPASADMEFPFILDGPGVGRLLRIWPPSTHYGHRWPPSATIPGAALAGITSAFARWAESKGQAR